MNDWNSVINADLKDAEFSGGSPIPDGDYEGTVASIEAKTFETGSKGLVVEFALMVGGELRTIKDYYVVQLADGSANKTGSASVKKLLLETGIRTEELAKFKFPAYDSKQFGDFKKILEAPVNLTIKMTLQKKGKNAGKSFARVKSFTASTSKAA
jgi:hypothetical protein